MPSITSGIPGGQDDVSIRNVPYIVVKGDKLKNVAVRFMVPFKTLKKINKISSKNFTCYPGMTLLVPVKVRPHMWDPSVEMSSDAGMLSQDRIHSVEYEVIGEGFDYDIKDDFIPASEAMDDSVQFIRVGSHITYIDRRVSQLSFRMDSLKQTEFSFGHDDDINSVLGRMRLARDRYYINGPLGKEIDSLHRVKATLNNLRIRLRNRITEYEYLRDNEAYARANYEREEMAKDTHWGDQITYESNYARIKAKHDELMVSDTAARPHTDTAVATPAPMVQRRDTVPATPAVAVDTTHHQEPPAVKAASAPAPTVAEAKPAKPAATTTAPPASAPATAVTPATKPVTTPAPVAAAPKASAPVVTPPAAAAPATSAAPRVSFGLLQRVDIAPLLIRHARVNIAEHPRQKGVLALLPAESTGATAATIASPAPAASAQAHISTMAKDTAAPAATSKPDTAHAAPAVKNVEGSKTAVTKPDTTHTAPAVKSADAPQAAVIKPDTAHKATLSTAKNDTGPKPATSSTATKGTTPVVAKADTARKPASLPAKTDTAGKATAVSPILKDTTKHTATNSQTSQPANAAPVAQNKDNTKTAPAARDTAHNFSLSEDNNFDSPASTHTDTARPHDRSDASPSAPATADNTSDIATGGAAGKPGKRPKDQAKKDKKQADTQEQAPVVVDSSKILHEQVSVPRISRSTPEVPVMPGPYFTLDMKYDSSMLYKEKKINADPLASYKTDSNFMATDVMLKEIPITEVKNKPKYLIPVDSVSKIKGEFYLIRARQVLERGDFKEGDKYLRKSLELDPNNASTWMLHADLCLTTGAADKALKEYAISGEIDSTNPKVFYNIALLYSKANDNQKAYKYFSRATDVNDKYLLAYMGRATVLMDERDYEGAIQDYDKTLSINRYYSPAYKGRALAKMEAHKFEDAIVDFNQYLEIEDPDGYILYQRGIAKILSNNLLQGCLDLSSSLELGFKEADRAIKKFCQ